MTSHTQNTGHKNGSTQTFLGAIFQPGQSSRVPSHSCSVWLVVELEHTGPHASENHLSVPLEHHLSTPIWTASHSGCWVGAALLLAAVVVVVVVVECVCGWGGGGDGELAGLLFLLLPLPILTFQTNMQCTQPTRVLQTKHIMIQTVHMRLKGMLP